MSDFAKKVYEIVKKIPRGRVVTYQDIAKGTGFPRAARAVGNALNKNRSKDVPCHRVVCSSGLVGGFIKGSGEKIRLLRQEGVKIVIQKIIR